MDPLDKNNRAIIHASQHGDLENVRLFLTDPRVDPTTNDIEAIHDASFYEHIEIVSLLSDSRMPYSKDVDLLYFVYRSKRYYNDYFLNPLSEIISL